MRLLLHTCCAPCEIYPLEQIRKKGFEVSGVFYNPNIHPACEYKRRKGAVEEFSRKNGMEIIFPDYNPDEFFGPAKVKDGLKERCASCWSLRLAKTAKLAKDKGFTHFSTTLLVSPYQDQQRLKQIGSEIAVKEGLEFYYEDFRPGFRHTQDTARQEGIYRQKYCGCVYSFVERFEEKCKKSVKR